MKIGFIGLGNMGLPMARNLIAAGHELTAFDIDPSIKAEFKITDNLAVVAGSKDVIFTMLPGGFEVQKVHRELIPFCSSGTVMVDCSTIDVKTARSISIEAEKSDLLTLDSPVSGGVVGAEKGTLTFMVGGSRKAYDLVKPLFDVMGQKSVFCGSSGAGQSAKICNNMILGISMIGVCEAFSLAGKLGLDRAKVFEVASSSSGQCWSLTTYCPAKGVGPDTPADNEYRPGFSVELMLKDLLLAQEAAENVNAHTPLGKHASKLYQILSDSGQSDKDFSCVLPFLDKKNRS